MTDIIRHIEYLIRRHDRLVLPGIGCIIAQYSQSAVNSKGDKLTTPARVLSFNSSIKASDGLLESSISRKEDISLAHCASEVNLFSNKIRRHLLENGFFVLGTLGQFVMEKGELRFIPSLNDLAYNPYRVYSIIQEKDDTATNAPHKRYIKVAKRGLKIAAMLAVCFSIAAMLFMAVELNIESLRASLWPQIDETASYIEKNELNYEGNIADTFLGDIPEVSGELFFEAHKTVIPFQNNHNRYVIIVGSFASESQANKFIAEQNINSGGIYKKDGNYRVFIYSPASKDEIEEVASSYSVRTRWTNAWIARYQ